MKSLGRKGYLVQNNKKYFSEGCFKSKRSSNIIWELFDTIQQDMNEYKATKDKVEQKDATIHQNDKNLSQELITEDNRLISKPKVYDEEMRKVIMENLANYDVSISEEQLFNPKENFDLEPFLYNSDGCYIPSENIMVNSHGVRCEIESPHQYVLMMNYNRKDRIICRQKDLDKWMQKSSIELKDLTAEHLRIISYGVPNFN